MSTHNEISNDDGVVKEYTSMELMLITLKRLDTAARYVALADNSNNNPEAVELRAALKQSENLLEEYKDCIP